MKKIIVQGGRSLKGDVFISGSKNAALPIMAATLLCDEEIVLKNVPNLRDTILMKKLLEKLGKETVFKQSEMTIKPKRSKNFRATYDIVKQMRASICVLGPLLARHGKAQVSFPGGCVFGPRPIDIHIKAMQALGAELVLDHGYISAQTKKLIGAKMNLLGEFGSSVLATDNAIAAATLAQGQTIIEGAAREPETQDLIGFLKKMGAKIEGGGTDQITIHGVKKLSGCSYEIIPDRIEAGSFIVFSVISGGEVKIHGLNKEHLEGMLDVFEKMGLVFDWEKTNKGEVLTVHALDDFNQIKSIEVTARPYPLFPTDMQPLLVALLSLVKGKSTVRESVYPNRFGYVSELQRMGAKMHVEKDSVTIDGVKSLSGAIVEASDLRGAAALVAAALAADGESHVRRYYHLERGYEDFDKKLKALGADVEMVDDDII